MGLSANGIRAQGEQLAQYLSYQFTPGAALVTLEPGTWALLGTGLLALPCGAGAGDARVGIHKGTAKTALPLIMTM